MKLPFAGDLVSASTLKGLKAIPRLRNTLDGQIDAPVDKVI